MNVDFSGHDVGNFQKTSSWIECQNFCNNDAKCVVWSLNRFNSCWLKKSNVGRKRSMGTVSGTKFCGGIGRFFFLL